MNYAEAVALLKGKRYRNLPSIRSTHIERLMGGDEIALYYHGTPVVTWYPDGRVRLLANGWKTDTTKARINTYSPVSVFQHRFVWYVVDAAGEHPFRDGMMIGADGRVEEA